MICDIQDTVKRPQYPDGESAPPSPSAHRTHTDATTHPMPLCPNPAELTHPTRTIQYEYLSVQSRQTPRLPSPHSPSPLRTHAGGGPRQQHRQRRSKAEAPSLTVRAFSPAPSALASARACSMASAVVAMERVPRSRPRGRPDLRSVDAMPCTSGSSNSTSKLGGRSLSWLQPTGRSGTWGGGETLPCVAAPFFPVVGGRRRGGLLGRVLARARGNAHTREFSVLVRG